MEPKQSHENQEEFARFAYDPAAYIAQQVSKFKLEAAATAVGGKAPPEGYLAGRLDEVNVKDFAISKKGHAKKV